MNDVEKLLQVMEAQLHELREIKEFLKPKENERVKINKSNVPYKMLIDLYNNTCTNLKKVEVLNDKRKRAIRKLWNSLLGDNPETWQQYFEMCNSDVWLNGTKYLGNLDTILQEDKVIRMYEQGARHE